MSVTATLRVVPQGTEVPRPDRIRDAAERLQELGIRVINTGQFSVIIMTDERRFERVLGVRAPARNTLFAQDIQPPERSLQGIVDRVEIAPQVQYLDM